VHQDPHVAPQRGLREADDGVAASRNPRAGGIVLLQIRDPGGGDDGRQVGTGRPWLSKKTRVQSPTSSGPIGPISKAVAVT
jgi:hypothetical protein